MEKSEEIRFHVVLCGFSTSQEPLETQANQATFLQTSPVLRNQHLIEFCCNVYT